MVEAVEVIVERCYERYNIKMTWRVYQGKRADQNRRVQAFSCSNSERCHTGESPPRSNLACLVWTAHD